jgi:hypothetical protein
MTKEDLPDAVEGGFIVFPRRMALAAVLAALALVCGPAVTLWASNERQDYRLVEFERRLIRIEERSESDRKDISEMKGDIKVIRQMLETRRQ